MSSLSTNSVRSVSARPSRHGILSLFGLAIAARRQRKALKSLNDAALRDLGLTRAEAEAEANRPIWDVPAHWRQ